MEPSNQDGHQYSHGCRSLSGAARRSPPREQSCCLFRLGLLSAHRASFTVTQAIRPDHDVPGFYLTTLTARSDRRVPCSGGKWHAVSERTQEHVAPYMAVGLSTVVHGIGSRKDIERNLQTEEPLAGRRAAAARRRGRDLPGQHRPPRRPGQLHPAGQSLSRRPVHRADGIPRRGRLGEHTEPMVPARGRIVLFTHP